MRSTTSRKWSTQDHQHLKDNLQDGIVKLSNHFGVSLGAIRKQCTQLGLSLRLNKAETPTVQRQPKASNSDKFNPNRDKIKNSSTAGKVPLWIEQDRMFVYLDADKSTQAHKDAVIQKFANRHKPIV